jgi:predicted RNA-binding protein YlqC (UPF0109 family)
VTEPKAGGRTRKAAAVAPAGAADPGTETAAEAATEATTTKTTTRKRPAKAAASKEAPAPEAHESPENGVEVKVDAAPVAGPPTSAAPPSAGEGLFSLERCVEFVLRAIVQNQEALTIVRKDEPDKVRISVSVAPEDLGKVIGKQGRTINALRTVVKTAAANTDTQVVVDLEGKAD